MCTGQGHPAEGLYDDSDLDFLRLQWSRPEAGYIDQYEGIHTMAEFLTTAGVSYQLEEIIKSATERLVIISPYLKVNKRIKELLEDRDRMKIPIRVIYRTSELHPDESNWLESMTSIRTSICEDLHAKCYLNENKAILTSMNLYEFSQANNIEMGLLVSREKDPELYDEILQESLRVERASEGIRVTVTKVDPADSSGPSEKTRKEPTLKKPENGFCIRCAGTLPADPTKPYCKRCYASWSRYENETYEENHCHTCGNECTSTLP